MNKFELVTIYPNQSIKDALKIINSNGLRSAVVVNKQLKLLGIINDGNIRRALLKGALLSNKIQSFYSKEIIFFKKNEVKKSYLKQVLIKKNLNIIPIVNKNNKLVNFFSILKISRKKFHKQGKSNILTVIMVGGKGTRLKPFTDVLPKPMVPIGDKSVLEHVIKKFLYHGMNKFIFTVQFKARIIKAYIRELKPIINIKFNFIEEKKPLGTAGGLGLINKKIKKAFFVTNCDTIIKTDLNVIYSFHKENNNIITLVVATKEFKIPYGVCKTRNNGEFNNLTEKPTMNYLINTGLYVLSPKILKHIPKHKHFNFNELINLAKKKQFKIGLFPIEEDNWIDVGQWNEYKSSIRDLEKIM